MPAARMPLWRVICARIRDHFHASGESLKEFAHHLGVDRSTLGNWIAERTAPRLDNIDAASMHLRVPRRCLQCDPADTVCPSCNAHRRPPPQPAGPPQKKCQAPRGEAKSPRRP